MSDDFYDAFSVWPDSDINAADGAAADWMHDEIVRMAVARFGPTVMLTVNDGDGERSYPLLDPLGDLALRGAWGRMTVAFGRPGEKPVRLGPRRKPARKGA
jgi:hypothetical protein